jgi:pimeloyl-ACP methyl ester carboxylesterase
MPEEEKQRLLNNHPSQDNAKTTVTNATQKPLSDEQQALAIQTHMAVEETAWQWWLLEGMDQVIAEQMSQLRNSVTILASQDDPVIPYDTICREVLELVPDANLVTTKGVGHLIPLEAADWVVKQVRQITTM